MALHPSSSRLVTGSDPLASPRAASSTHTASQLDLRLNSIQGEALAVKAKPSGNDVAEHAKAVGHLIDEALRHSGLTQKEASFRMGYADASKLASWISGEGVSRFLARFLSLPELQKGFLVALAEHSGVTVRTVIEVAR